MTLNSRQAKCKLEHCILSLHPTVSRIFRLSHTVVWWLFILFCSFLFISTFFPASSTDQFSHSTDDTDASSGVYFSRELSRLFVGRLAAGIGRSIESGPRVHLGQSMTTLSCHDIVLFYEHELSIYFQAIPRFLRVCCRRRRLFCRLFFVYKTEKKIWRWKTFNATECVFVVDVCVVVKASNKNPRLLRNKNGERNNRFCVVGGRGIIGRHLSGVYVSFDIRRSLFVRFSNE